MHVGKRCIFSLVRKFYYKKKDEEKTPNSGETQKRTEFRKAILFLYQDSIYCSYRRDHMFPYHKLLMNSSKKRNRVFAIVITIVF